MTLHKQAASLTLMYAVEVLQPLLILPYAGRVLGPVAFGQYVYTLAVTQLGCMVVDYGFSFSARRAAAAARHDTAAVRAILAQVIAARAILCTLVAVFGLTLVGMSETLNLPMFWCLVFAMLGQMLFPSWLFMALERHWQAAVSAIAARILALVAFLTIIASPSQAYVAAFIQVSIPLVAAIISLPFVLKIGFGGFKLLTWKDIGAQFRDGRRSFISTAAYTVTALLPVPLVQHFSGFAAVGQYSVAEKLVSGIRPVFAVIADSLMPRVAYLAHHDPEKGISLIHKSLWSLIIGVALSLFLLIAGPYIILFLFGPDFAGAIPIVYILCGIPIAYNLSICMAQLYMFNYGYEKAWTALIVASLPMFLVSAYTFSHWFNGAAAVALGLVASEFLIAVISSGIFVRSILIARRKKRITSTGVAPLQSSVGQS